MHDRFVVHLRIGANKARLAPDCRLAVPTFAIDLESYIGRDHEGTVSGLSFRSLREQFFTLVSIQIAR